MRLAPDLGLHNTLPRNGRPSPRPSVIRPLGCVDGVFYHARCCDRSGHIGKEPGLGQSAREGTTRARAFASAQAINPRIGAVIHH